MSDDAVIARLFGKMPTHGDFVARGISRDLQARLDEWLSSEMELARSACGDGFEARYDLAPPWCFAGVGQDGLWQGGALCPSIDATGRRFPLFVARRRVAASEAASAAEYCVDAIFRAFDDRLSADELCQAISGMALAPAEVAVEQGWWADGDDRLPSMAMSGEYPTGLISAMLEGVEL